MELKLITFITRNFLFFSYSCLNKVFENKLILKNGKYVINSLEIFKINDIITIPTNYIDFILKNIVDKFLALKRLKKKNYIFFKNKASQWKSIKKKPAEEGKYNLHTRNVIESNLEFDIFSAQVTMVKQPAILNRFEKFTIRHNLEKLNTYKLNV